MKQIKRSWKTNKQCMQLVAVNSLLRTKSINFSQNGYLEEVIRQLESLILKA